ncbi:hypothetical protein [Streptomyces sp. NPDC059701]|uniref:WXG100 family type VII secretion target n=1 Tax=Streptomyces sp. NPDC059701 TaxID=3346914 RepID=UPI00367F7ABE
MTDKQHEQDLERVSGQNTFTDLTRHAEEHPGGGFLSGVIDNLVRSAAKGTPYARGVHGRTDFDNHRLNDMIDLVEQTNPEDLESSGKALWDARDAITEAAKELDGHIEKVHWVGKSGEAFRKWGRSLVTSTYGLSDFAGGAGDQITAAAVGLAAVRKAMPPRDTRPESQALKPDKLPTPKQVEGNAEYAEAVRVEKNRQEAINQMNRLSSYYAVANEQLTALPQPDFKTMPDVGVPKPAGGYETWPQSTPTSSAQRAESGSGSGPHAAGFTSGHTSTHGAPDTPLPPTQASGKISYPDAPTLPSVGTSIDSVGTLPPPTTPPVTGHTPPVPTTPVANGNTNFPGQGYGLPLPQTAAPKTGRTPGGLRAPVSAQGLTGKPATGNSLPGRTTGPGNSLPGRATGPGNSLPGRPTGPGQGPLRQFGQPAPTGQPTARGTTGGPRSVPMGRGVTGGTPRAGGTGAPRPAGGPATGAGRSNGVVGGRPTTAPATGAGTGRQIPRGTVVGGGTSATPQSSAGRPPQRGVVGAPQPPLRQGAGANGSRAVPGKSAPVTSKPATRTSVTGAERNGMTRGGAGLRRGPGGRGEPGDRRETDRAGRPDREVEEEESGTDLPTEPRRDTSSGSH